MEKIQEKRFLQLDAFQDFAFCLTESRENE